MTRRIPASIRVAILALACAIGLLAYATVAAAATGGAPGWAQIAFAALVGVLLLGGILARQRLAWLWGHALSLFLGVLQAVTLGLAIHQHAGLALPSLLLSVAVVLALLGAHFSLGRPSALAHFDLLCPACGTQSRMGADFLFRKARCRKCGSVW